MNPFVSIACVTYNHEPYIRQCLDGFLMQKTDFDFEIVIHDDASTDGTREVILEYCENYPHLFRPILQKENRYKEGKGIYARFVFPECRGKYIAMCEGDDYWIDPLKLQKQVDFLEINQDVSLCCHNYMVLENEIGNFREAKTNKEFDEPQSVDLNTYVRTHKWIAQPLTIMFRRNNFVLSEYERYSYAKDMTLIYYLLTKGNLYRMSDNMGVYRVHNSGAYSSISFADKLFQDLNSALAISWVQNDKLAVDYAKPILEEIIRSVGMCLIMSKIPLFLSACYHFLPYYGIGYVPNLLFKKVCIFLNKKRFL